MFLFLMAGVALTALAGAFFDTKRLTTRFHNASYLPKGINLLLLSTQAAELVRAVEQASLVHVVTALFLLVVIVSTNQELKDPLH